MNIALILATSLIATEVLLRIHERLGKLLRFDIKKYPYYRYKANIKGRSPWYVSQIGRKDTPVIKISDLGIRGSFISGKKNILCLGCSFTEGAGLSDKNTYPGKLSELISNDSYNVVNAGLPGYGIFQIARLCDDLIKAKPEIVILQTLDFYRYPLSSTRVGMGKLIFKTKALIRQVSLLINRFVNLITPDRFTHLGGPYFIHSAGISNEEIWSLNKKYLDQIKEACTVNSIKLVIFQWPGQVYFYKKIEQYCRNNNIYNASTNEIYSYYNENELRLHKYDRHPNTLANSLIAKAVYTALKSNGIV